jgi:arylsulfatase A-like enzyme
LLFLKSCGKSKEPHKIMSIQEEKKVKTLTWRSLFTVTFLASTIYVFMEWLFIITKPSSMTIESLQKKIATFLFTASLAAGFSFLAILFIVLIGLLPPLRKKQNLLIKLGYIQPAVVLSALLLLMLDNFTYTVFSFGIVSSTGVMRGVYMVLFILGIILIWRYLVRRSFVVASSTSRILSPRAIYLGLIGTILLSFFISLLGSSVGEKTYSANSGPGLLKRPNILYITSDGVSASHTSLYGYVRDTTPTLVKLAKTSLVAENDFPNAGQTAGSIVSIMTGKYATTTDFLYPPNILRGNDAYQHLPGLLRSQGYLTVEFGPAYFLDPTAINLLDGFDIFNGRSIVTNPVLSKLNHYLPNDYTYFVYQLGDRIYDRLRHIFYIKTMTNPMDQINQPAEDFVDSDKIKALEGYLDQSGQPVFVHIHLMGTHGPTFRPAQHYFSKGQSFKTQGLWNIDFSDDAIREFDANVDKILDDLKDKGLMDKTILVVGTDHSQQWFTTKRLPLIFRFPGGDYAGKVNSNTQNLDIAPTILDYLGMAKPAWMEGQSILPANLPNRPIFGFSVTGTDKAIDPRGGIDNGIIKPPFYQFGLITVVYCNQWYSLDLEKFQWKSGNVEGSTAVCDSKGSLSDKQIYGLMIDQLKGNGFDTSSLSNITPYLSPQK